VKFAYEIDSDSPGSEQKQQITIDKIEIDPALDQGRFDKPVAPPATPSSALPEPDHPHMRGAR